MADEGDDILQNIDFGDTGGAGPAPGNGEDTQPAVGIISQYVKDLSFENPNAIRRRLLLQRGVLSQARASPPYPTYGLGRPIGGKPRWLLLTTQGREVALQHLMLGPLKERQPWPTTTWPGGYVRGSSSQPM